MYMSQDHQTRVLAIALLAGASTGIAHAATDESPQYRTNAVNVAHIYYNAVTGERVATLLSYDQFAGADTGNSELLWSTFAPYPDCFDTGPTSFFFALDDATGTTSLSTNVALLDYGDIEKDTVVDCISVNWVTSYPDTDSDSDSIGDGVEELAGQWMVWDADNGREINSSTRLPVLDVLFFNLPGNVAAPGFFSGYSLDIDLVGLGTATDLSFELGDSDGDCQSAAFCNSMVDYDSDSVPDGPISGGDRDFDGLLDSDLDGDGLFDWSWCVRFYHPGTGNDFDMDSDTGSAAPSDSDTMGIMFGYPAGFEPHPDGSIDFDPNALGAATGYEERFVLKTASGYFGGFFGSLQCPDPSAPEFVPPSVFQFALWGPGDPPGPCIADLNMDGVVDFFDISLFLMCYQQQEPQCDFNNDGILNFFDVSIFLQYVNDC
jgi:hypothetical protein